MIIEPRIKAFEKLGFGMFVHFGLYSKLGMGEWALKCLNLDPKEYESLAKDFCPEADWAQKLVATAKNAGCKYITLTARHHDGYSLYDTCGMNDYDAPHSCGRDLVKEFVDACNAEGILPFFYHTLIDWRESSCPYSSEVRPELNREGDWETYMEYLQKSVELLCKNYGKIGGIWFDGMWAYWENDWQEDKLYGMIRSYQPDAMIINNTGMHNMGQLGHIQLDSVTFERDNPQPLNMEGAPKYVASEMCEVFGSHWGYAKDDLFYKSPAQLIETLAVCRKCGSNMLLNVGPMGDGYLRPLDAASLDMIGQWVSRHEEAIRAPRPSGIEVEGKPNDFLLRDGNTYYLFCMGLPMTADLNVQLGIDGNYESAFCLDGTIKSVRWMDNGKDVPFTVCGEKVTVTTQPFSYGYHWVVRVAKIECE